MRKRKTIKVVAVLMTLCLLLTAFSGSAIQAQAEELGLNVSTVVQRRSNSTLTEFYFRHLYDPETFNLHRHYIVSAVSFVDQVYSAEFSVTFPNTGPISEDTVTDISDCTMDMETPCLNAYCGSYTSHHKDVKLISDTLLAWRRNSFSNSSYYDNYIVVLWTDRETGTYCYYHQSETGSGYVHEYKSSHACVISHRPVIHIMNIGDDTTAQRIPHMSLVLAHELAHCFGAEDLYSGQIPNEHKSDEGWRCLVGAWYTNNNAALNYYENLKKNYDSNPNNDTETEPFCDACRSAISYGLAFQLPFAS